MIKDYWVIETDSMTFRVTEFAISKLKSILQNEHSKWFKFYDLYNSECNINLDYIVTYYESTEDLRDLVRKHRKELDAENNDFD